jgi:NAD(P)-dependent dehydrogenase (short-subunit alcohol dehydrogenase family)
MAVSKEHTGKVAFVTGAGTGIGRATAIAFAREGVSVAAVGRSETSLQETVRSIEAAEGRALAIRCDVAEEDEVKAAIAKTVGAFGRLDFAFNNAGVEQPPSALADVSPQEWDRIIAVNLNGVFFCMKHQIPHMLKQGGGSIVNTSSGAGVKGFRGQSAYCAAKFGVVGLSKAAALDYAAQGVRVNVVSPGMVATPMMDRFTGGTEEGRQGAIAQEPVGRAGRPEEIAGTVVWLCSDLAAFTTGANIVVDGGQTT